MERIFFAKNLEKFVERAIIKFVQDSPYNRRKVDGGKFWDIPLVGFASGKDPLFKQYKKIIGKFHFTPQEIFDLTFGRSNGMREVSVISWILPASENIRKSNRKEVKCPSLLWAHTRDFGEQFNIRLRNNVVALLKKRGYKAVAPMNPCHWKSLRSPRVGLASNWSARHIAYACGLGAFGLSDGLITAKGKAIRVGSVVTDLCVRPSEKNTLITGQIAFTTLMALARPAPLVALLRQSQQRGMTKTNASNTVIAPYKVKRLNMVLRSQDVASVKPKSRVNSRFQN